MASTLVALAEGPPVGMAAELAGPREEDLTELARAVARVRGGPRWVLPVRLPGAVGRGMAGGALLPTAPGPRGEQTFDQWLAQQSPAA